MPCILHPLLDGFALQLCEHDANIQHGPSHRRGSIELLCERNKLHIVLLEQHHHVGEVQNGTADAVQFVNDHPGDQPTLDVLHQHLKLGPVRIFTAVTLVLIFLATPASQFVFAKLTLTFDGNTILFVNGLSCINRVNSVVHFALPF